MCLQMDSQNNSEDGGDGFHYPSANVEQITWFTLTVQNKENELMLNFKDFTILLKFIGHKTEEGKIETSLKKCNNR